MSKYLSSDNDPLHRFHQWQANLRILEVTEIKWARALESVRQPLGSDTRIGSGAAIETNGDLRLVVTRAYPAFALPVRYACDGC
jgi:hypothetical protein